MPRPIQPKPNKDHWGFYQVGPYKTYSKLDAIEVSGRTKHDIVWNFNNEVFGAFDWTQEPPGDLEFWYQQRAEQLRENYDYIILFYSGGWDAHNILRTFVKNNIFIDEIVHMATIKGFNGDKNVNANKEIFEVGFPVIKNLIETNPVYRNTKQTVIDISDVEQDFLNDDKWDYFYKTNVIFSPAIYATAELREKNLNLLVAHEKNPKVCQLFGIDKPRVWVDDQGNAKIVFTEVAPLAYVHSGKREKNLPWANDEMFYWTPDMPELACKQAHVVLRYLQGATEQSMIKQNLSRDSLTASRGTWKPQYSSKQYGDWLYHLDDQIIADLVYRDNLPNYGVKASSLFFGGKDQWLWNPHAPDIGQKRYLKGLVWLKQTVLKSRPDLWWDRPGDPKTGTLPTGGFIDLKNTYHLTKRQLI